MDVDSARRLICDIGRRCYERGLVVAAEGNLSIRVDSDAILCTPSGKSKGYLKPSELCIVDVNGQQIEGDNRPSSELKLHLEVYRRRVDVDSVIHCHPPHATAFAIAREAIPSCVTAEAELFLGEIPIAPYGTPGTSELSDSITPFVERTNVIVLANHGTISYDTGLERALWSTEILESYCRTLILARQLGPLQYLTDDEVRRVLEQMRTCWGVEDIRLSPEFENEDLRHNPVFRDSWPDTGIGRRSFLPPDPSE